MKKLEKIMMTIIIICIGWIIVQTIYGVGRAKGYIKGYEDAMIENETRISQAYQTGFEKCLE